jgi:hypothetical protein
VRGGQIGPVPPHRLMNPPLLSHSSSSHTHMHTTSPPLLAASLKRMARSGFASYAEEPREEWVLQQPAQLVIAVSQIYWCTAVGGQEFSLSDPGSVDAGQSAQPFPLFTPQHLSYRPSFLPPTSPHHQSNLSQVEECLRSSTPTQGLEAFLPSSSPPHHPLSPFSSPICRRSRNACGPPPLPRAWKPSSPRTSERSQTSQSSSEVRRRRSGLGAARQK